jgi:hypothetical protein
MGKGEGVTMKLIVVDCLRASNQHEGERKRCIVFASDEVEAERLCREELSREGFTQFTVHEPKEGPFPGPARVLYYDGRQLSVDEMLADAGRAVA